jgi:hypothetical protein
VIWVWVCNELTHKEMGNAEVILGSGLAGKRPIRPVQAEYFLRKFTDGASNLKNNLRYSAGIIFRFSAR